MARLTITRRPTRRQLLRVVGELAGTIAEMANEAGNDRGHDRAANVHRMAREAQALAFDTRRFDPPVNGPGSPPPRRRVRCGFCADVGGANSPCPACGQ